MLSQEKSGSPEQVNEAHVAFEGIEKVATNFKSMTFCYQESREQGDQMSL
jgi:hypothetical protein